MNPYIIWKAGSAYDLFISLSVLHHPERFGLRPSWAAGVRSRLPQADRRFLEDAQELFFAPLRWLATLPPPWDAAGAIRSLADMPPAIRLPALSDSNDQTTNRLAILSAAAARGSWNEADLEALRLEFQQSPAPHAHRNQPRRLAIILDQWAHSAEFGERYLSAIQSYYEVFFQEEEARLYPHLQRSVLQAQSLADRMSLPDLLAELSQGVHFAALPECSELILAPSYWLAPLIAFDTLDDGRVVFVFGARPIESALVPGEAVPDVLLNGLKALADPTRLKILHHLSGQPLTPSQLARRLRLRPPTVVHHLNALRLAGLVHLTLEEEGERRYAIRSEALQPIFAALQKFLESQERDRS